MPRFEITSPDGGRYEITAPDGATERDVMRYIGGQGGRFDAPAAAQSAAQTFRQLPGSPADAALDPNRPASMPPAESPITHRGLMLPFAERADGSMELAWPQIAVDTMDSLRQLGRAAESAEGVPHSPAETFPRPQDAILANYAIPGTAFPLAGPPRIPPRVTPPRIGPTAANAQSAAEDLAAFERQQVPVLSPAFGGAPTRMASKGLSEMYGVGAPLQNAIEDTYRGMAAASERVADDLAPRATYDQAGSALQAGLDRFRTAGVRDVEPGVLLNRGVEPRAPVQPQDVMSNAAAARAQAAEPIRAANQGGMAETSRGVLVPSARSRNQRIIARRSAADLTDDELNALVRSPADQTSFAVRSEALYERANRQVPAQMRVNDTANPQQIRAVNAQNAINGLAQEQARSRIPGGVLGRYAGMAERLRTNVTLPTIEAMRTAVGRDLANFSYGEVGLDRTQLKTLYAALSRDKEVALQDLANRAHKQTRVSPNRPDYVAPDVARAADRALYEYRRADKYFRQGIARMDTFLKVVSADNPQTAAGRMVRAATEGAQGDIRMFANAMNVLRPEERAQFASLVLRELGKPLASARGIAQDVGFSPQTFVTRVSKMDERAFNLMFPGEHGAAVRDLMRIANRLANVERFENASGSGRMSTNVGGILAAIGSLATGNVVAPVATAGGGYMLSTMLAHPAFARWLASYGRVKLRMRGARQGANQALAASLRELGRLAATEPALQPVLRAALLENGIRVDAGDDHEGNEVAR